MVRGSERTGYVGDAACAYCHQQQAHAYLTTAHHLASQLPSGESILGSFAVPSNRLWIQGPQANPGEPTLYFEMNRKPDGFFQTAVAELGEKRLTHTERIDLVFGSGHRGQSYLYWSGKDLSELPVSFWTEGQQWINSPGYRDGTANFSRHADPRCMECHTTYIQALSSQSQSFRYDPDTLVPGIACETCHGPGAPHVCTGIDAPICSPSCIVLLSIHWHRESCNAQSRQAGRRMRSLPQRNKRRGIEAGLLLRSRR